MPTETPLYQSFNLISPWFGTFHFYIDNFLCYREALDLTAEVTQQQPIKQLEQRVYDMAYREACRQAEKP